MMKIMNVIRSNFFLGGGYNNILLSSTILIWKYLDYGRNVEHSSERAVAIIVGWFLGCMYNNHNKCYT
jgi:hypothetical protein